MLHHNHRWLENNCCVYERHRSVTFAARDGVIPVSADSVQTRQRRLSEQSVTREALEGNGHPHAVVLTDHDAVTERSWVGAPL